MTDNTDLVSEGFPRSANTFFEAALLVSQNDSIDVASHSHSAAQVIMAVKRGTPAVVLFREPFSAIASLLELTQADLSIETYVKDYYSFYETIEAYFNDIMLVEFTDAIGDFPGVVERINARFGLDLVVPHADLQFDNAVNAKMDELGLRRAGWVVKYGSSVSEDDKRARLERKQKYAGLLKEPRFAKRLARCMAIYERMLDASGVALKSCL